MTLTSTRASVRPCIGLILILWNIQREHIAFTGTYMRSSRKILSFGVINNPPAIAFWQLLLL